MQKFILSVISFVCLVSFSGVSEQGKTEANKAVRIIARRNDSTVSLRWAPTSSAVFTLGKQNGYRVERAEIKGGSPGSFTMVNENHPVIPWPVGGWQWFLSQMVNPD